MAPLTLIQWLQGQQETLLHPLSLSLLLVSLYFLLKLYRASTRKPNLPPSPPKFPIIGNFHQLGPLLHRSLRALSQEYGPLMLLHMGGSPFLVVSSADMAREFTKTHDLIFASRPVSAAGKQFFYGCTNLLFSPYGEYWRQMRKICVLELLSIKRVQSFKSVREEEVEVLIKKISSSCQAGTLTNISELLLSLSNNIISKVALGRKYGDGDDDNRLGHLLRELLVLLTRFSVRDTFPMLGWIDTLTGLDGSIRRNSKELDDFLDQVIEDHQITKRNGEKADQEDFVHILLNAQKDSTLNVPLTRDNIKAIILDMFAAGTDTTSVTMEWAMAELVKHPNVMKKAQEEVRRVVGKKSKVEEDDIHKMDYLKCIIKEILRLHPPVSTMIRESAEDINVKGYHIPSKTRVFINAWAIQRDPKVWDNPEEFIPERFIDNPVDLKGQDYQFIPFGAGRRGCPGMSFGLATSEFVLANLLHWFDWELPSGEKEDLDMSEAFGVTVYKKVPLNLLPMLHSS